MTKKEAEELIAVYKEQAQFFKDQVAELREEKVFLQKQVQALQDGILSVRAPDAYRDLKMDGIPVEGLSAEELHRAKIFKEVLPRHLDNLEKPMFTGADDLITTLSSVVASSGVESKSIHGNDES